MIKISILAILTGLMLIVANPQSAQALSCIPGYESRQEQIVEAEYIFEATIIAPESVRGRFGGAGAPAVAEVIEQYKGSIPGDIEISVSSMWDNFTLKQGATYLFIFDENEYQPDRQEFTRDPCNYSAFYSVSSAEYREITELLANTQTISFYIVNTAVLAVISSVGWIIVRNR